jgi:hypothetical protein
MPLNHENATATVSVIGLSVGCFNPKTRNWEVALIRHPRHILTIDVIRRNSENQRSELTFKLDHNHSLYVEAIEPVITRDGEAMYTKDPFDRKNPEISDPEDFRWIVDLEKEFNAGERINVAPPLFPVTEMFVSHPVLYADRDEMLDDMQVLKLGVNGVAPESEPFGSFAESAKADITCEPGGSVVLRVEGPLGFSLPLPHIEGGPHEIRIRNVCPTPQVAMVGGQAVTLGEPAPSDFRIYFDLFKPNSGAIFDLAPLVEGPQGSDAVCNNTFLGSSESLLPIS